MKKIRTRYAPSPTGYLHIGGARTALFSFLYAKHFDGDFIVRIEDTDIARNVSDGEDSQLDNLAWLGIVPDESPRNPIEKYGPYRQSEKLERYNKIVEELLEKDFAYKAFDTTEELDEQRAEQESNGVYSFRYDREWLKISDEEKNKREENDEYSIRLKLKKDTDYSWDDLVRGRITVNTSDIGDFVIRKQNGYPTYNFAVVVDDHDMEITDILRGEEHTTNTPKQLAIYDAMEWDVPKFGHLTIITNMKGKKLSKRDTELRQFISQYKEEGYAHKSIFNFLALLGWTHPEAKEIMDMDEIISSFDYERLSKSPSKFDIKKMDWFSKEYIKHQKNSSVAKGILYTFTDKYNWNTEDEPIEYLANQINRSVEWLNDYLDSFKVSAVTFKDVEKHFAIYEDRSVKKIEKNEVVQKFAELLNNKEFNIENIQETINEVKNELNVKGKELFMPIRLSTTYQEHGPELAKAIYLCGEELIKERLA